MATQWIMKDISYLPESRSSETNVMYLHLIALFISDLLQYEDGEEPPEELEGVLSCTLAAGCRCCVPY